MHAFGETGGLDDPELMSAAGDSLVLVVRFELAPGLHIYDEPVPDGMVATRIEVNGPEGVNLGEVRKQETHPLQLPGLDLELQVWSNQVDFVIPLSVNDRLASFLNPQPDEALELDITVHYQACDDQVCRIPQSSTLHLSIPFGVYTTPSVLPVRGTERSTMDSKKHMKRMVLLGLLRSPIKGLRFIRDTADAIRKGPLGRRGKSSR